MRRVERAFIYGSWASRYHGEPGPQPQDIDVLVIGSANVTDVRTEADIATGTLGRDVNVAVLTPAERDRAASGFTAHCRVACRTRRDRTGMLAHAGPPNLVTFIRLTDVAGGCDMCDPGGLED